MSGIAVCGANGQAERAAPLVRLFLDAACFLFSANAFVLIAGQAVARGGGSSFFPPDSARTRFEALWNESFLRHKTA
ncbi:MAG: hypothetical protein K2J81_08920, partial [Treponemataceae bacterium]|nr:hypothetical protein [Treponemataceae bacterium]